MTASMPNSALQDATGIYSLRPNQNLVEVRTQAVTGASQIMHRSGQHQFAFRLGSSEFKTETAGGMAGARKANGPMKTLDNRSAASGA